MRILIDDVLITSFLTTPPREGWATLPVPFALCAGLTAADVNADDLALIPAGEATGLATTHHLAPEVAIVYGTASAIAMRAPVRPDGIDETPIRLYHTSRTAELLIRALLRPFFGITASGFITDADDGSDAQIVVVEGVDAINPPEAGFQEDLARAWFILTGLPTVSHVLVAPQDAADIAPAVEALRHAVGIGIERRKEIRARIAERTDVDRDRLVEVTNALRFQLAPADGQSLHQLVARGSWGMAGSRELPPVRPPTGS